MPRFRLHDWNDVRLLIACAECRSFAGAAAVLGLDQTTVSRRIGNMEAAIGRPLFSRRRSGATPTPAGLALLERARAMEAQAAAFEDAMLGLNAFPAPTVTIGASEGTLEYTLIPTLLGSATQQPLDRGLLRHPLPDLAFTSNLAKSDIALMATSNGEVPQVRGAVRVRRVGTMSFFPVAGRKLMLERPKIDRFDDLRQQPLLDVSIYRAIRSLADWNGIVVNRGGSILELPTSRLMHRALVDGSGVSILPAYSTFYDEEIVRLDLDCPPLGVALWLVAHEDKLREPVVRQLYDGLAAMFLQSPWFHGECR